ncbi:unnamed protein product (macronuclear) [Paramecium tetraurelia]|uniref:Uncharacterized protein n=1 Tax=Paramecium tetraurelia TaxID=5888 RepID=A0DZJ5_PARTE|nr:uncharacterized protein GSPATT00021629001 [Paramecium tetraurelia]CAK88462.1 unnamed protein product [Paramecium tetraurelia]|eukprot:XP_001455859.1 hypothetical protein (macronuclear) [Paramecium tetraurelia strain d4-2]
MNIIVFALLTFLFDLSFEISTTNYETDTKFNYCLNVVKGNCELCQQQYFLFSLPQDHNELGLKAGTRVCVECPYLKFNEANNYYCGDCLDNSQTWDKSRLCTYDYKTKSTGTSVFHKIERPAKQLFYVVKSGLQDFTTQSCDGCDHFCKSQNQTCLPVSKQFSYDLNNLYLSCTDGYEYSDVISGCDPCPENCKSCQINKYISLDDSGKTIVTIKKNCLICNTGFSLLTTRAELNGVETYSQCVACFTGCDACYFGRDGINLNEKPWDDYNNNPVLLTSNNEADEVQFFVDLFKLYRIAQRCEQCTSTTQSTFVPSLSRRACIRCGTNCKRCEYKFGSILPTRDKYKVVEPETSEPTTAEIEAVESQYTLRCRECDKFTQTFYAVGTGCTDCSIVNCKLCAKVGDPTLGSDSSFSTIALDFVPLPKEEQSLEKCLLCEDGYFLSDDYKTCTIFDTINKPMTGCLTYYKQTVLIQQCLQCDIGYTLYKNDSSGNWECRMDCSSLMQDYLCQSCVINGLKQRCLRCLDGFYVDMQTGKCAQCAENGHCKKCYTLSLVSVHHTEYFDYLFDGQSNTLSEKKILGPYCYECTPGDAFKGPILNEDLRYCEKGGENCAQFLAKGTKGYCDQCDSSLVGISLSSSIDDSDCIQCPEITIGCRERTSDEIRQFNQFYDPTDAKYKKYARLSFKCDDGGNNYYDSKIGRCISKTDCPTPCDRSDEITITADCQQNQPNASDEWKINSQYSDITSKNTYLILEDKMDSATRDALFDEWNKKAVTKITIILDFQYFSGDNAKCFFQKDTYFTSNIRKNVFSVQNLELKIQTNAPTPNQRIQWYIQKTIYFAYFTSISINGIELYPASDRGNLYSNIPKYETPFGFQFLNNTGSVFYLENVKIGNINAEDHYLDKSAYTTPYSAVAVTLKKQKPFFTILLNTYDIYLKNVVIQSQNYLVSSDVTFQAKPFGLVYDSDITLPYLNIRLENVKFYDIAVEKQALFELQSVSFLTPPQWNSKIIITQVQFEDCYFINDGAFLSTAVLDEPMGIVIINSLYMKNMEYNNSRGIVDFTTMQQIKVNNFQMQDSKVNSTVLFHITTIELSDAYLQNTKFTFKGRLIQTQYELKTIRINDPEFSGLKLQFINLEFDQVICLTPACLILITEIQNDYFMPINITMKGLFIKQINTVGFDETIWEAATSASIRIEKSNRLQVSDFESIENADLAIFYVEQVWTTKFVNINCHQKEGLSIRNNYCLFINNPYKGVELINIQLMNLMGRDNSFIGISSWSNLIYNTSTSEYQETIVINGVFVTQCTIITTVLAVPSSAILIDSTQMQIVQVNFMYFFKNTHLMEIQGSLRPSNPTFLIRSVVGTLMLQNSLWRSNSVSGYGSVLYLEVGTQIIFNVSMVNSNFDSETKTPFPSINEKAEGGHLFISTFLLDMSDCTFFNSTAKLGGGLYIKTLKEGKVTLKNISVRYAYTPLSGTVSSRGGCVYIDSMASELDMKIENAEFKDCFTRGEGGGIFLVSYDKKQQFTIQDSTITNCYALSGLAIKTLFYSRTIEQQKMMLQDVKISGNSSNSLAYLAQLGSFQSIEKFLFMKRIAAIEQDFGQIEVQNAYSEGLFYYGFLSIWQSTLIKLNTIESQHSILSYRPYIEIQEPLENPITVDLVQFRNISSISLANLNCTSITNNALCRLLEIRIEFPEYQINPALMLFDLISEKTPLTMKNVAINRVICKECHGGLVQIMRVSNSRLIPLVQMSSCRCSNSESSYYGCFSVSSDQYLREQKTMDKLIGTSLTSNLTLEKITQQTNMSDSSNRLLVSDTSNQIKYNFSYAIPNPSYLSHVIVESLNINDVKAIHGGGISFYGLTANVTSSYCSLAVVTGRGGCIYFESYPKDGGSIQHRLNIADSSFYRNNASIGGAIAVVESGINNYARTSITLIQNFASKYGDDVAQYPTSLGIRVKQVLQKQGNLDSHTGWLHYPLVIKSGQELKKFENQTVILVFLDKNNNIMSYQHDTECSLSSNVTKTKDNQTSTFPGETNRKFEINDVQGFDYSNQIINFDPYNQITLDAVFNSSHINIPIYHDQYPYQCKGFDTGYTLQVRIRSVECELGEQYNDQQETCSPCSVGTFALEYKTDTCRKIDETKMNYTFMNKISIKSSYWRPHYQSGEVEECKNKVYNCKGGFDVGNDLCQEGFIGALCEECDIYGSYWGESYSNSAKYECGLCQEKTRNQLMIAFITIFTIYSTLQSVKGHEDRMEKVVTMKVLRQLKLLSAKASLDQAAILMKIFNNFVQLLSILEGFKIDIPQGTVDTINTVSMPAKSMGNALDCFLVDGAGDVDMIYLRLIWSLAIQLLYIIAMTLIILVLIFKNRFKWKSLQTMAIYMFIFLQPTFLIEFANLIAWRDISGEGYIQANVSYKHDTQTHSVWLSWFAYPGFFVFLFVIPFIFFYQLLVGKWYERFDQIAFMQSWGYFYHEYSNDKDRIIYYWEFVRIYIRAFISILICLQAQNVIMMGSLSSILTFIYLLLSLYVQPYSNQKLNKIDQISNVILTLTFSIATIVYSTIQNENFQITLAGYVIMGFLIIPFLLYIIFEIVGENFESKANILDNIRDKINKKYPALIKARNCLTCWNCCDSFNIPKFVLQNRTTSRRRAKELWKDLMATVNESLEEWKFDRDRPFKVKKWFNDPLVLQDEGMDEYQIY